MNVNKIEGYTVKKVHIKSNIFNDEQKKGSNFTFWLQLSSSYICFCVLMLLFFWWSWENRQNTLITGLVFWYWYQPSSIIYPFSISSLEQIDQWVRITTIIPEWFAVIWVLLFIIIPIIYISYSKHQKEVKQREEAKQEQESAEVLKREVKRETQLKRREKEKLLSTVPSKIKLLVDDKKIADISEIPHGTSKYSSILSNSDINNLVKKMKNEGFGVEIDGSLIVASDYLENKLIYFSGIYQEKDMSFSFLAERSKTNNKLVSNELILRTLEKLKHQGKILGEINPTAQSIKFGESNKRAERASKVTDTIDNCNLLWRNITNSKNQLLTITKTKFFSHLYEECTNKDNFKTKIEELYNFLDKMDKEYLLNNVEKAEQEWKCVTLLNVWFQKLGKNPSEIMQLWRKIIELRNELKHEESKEIIEIYKYFSEQFPQINYSRLWDRILEEFLESLEKLQKILTEISQKND